MKIKYLKLKNWLIVSLAGLLGINLGCSKVDEYGCPEATYHVKGTVVNEEGQPIAGINVGIDTTGSDGSYNVTLSGFPRQPLSLYFHDIDSMENGFYKDTLVTINTENVQLIGGDGNWYEGEGNITQDVTLLEQR